MSKRLAENCRQLSEFLVDKRISLLSDTTTQSSLADNCNYFDEEEDDFEDTVSQKQKTFLKSVSSGNLESVEEHLSKIASLGFDLNAKDEENGTTALIYAACFGKFEIAEALLNAGAQIDIQDSRGWTALMWATANHHEKLIKLLLDHGASAQTRSANGRTVLDFVKSDHNMADIFSANNSKRGSVLSTTSHSYNLDSAYSKHNKEDPKYDPTEEINYKDFLCESRYKSVEEYLMNIEDDFEQDNEQNSSDISSSSDNRDIAIEFDWERCMPDQMFVFAVNDLPYILDSVITNIVLPVQDAQEIFVPANVIFLSARFAHYFSSAELVEDIMEGSIYRISTSIKKNGTSIHVLSYWMSNMTRLLYYLKKDIELVVATAEYQLRLSELISETYTYMVNDVRRRITQILEPAMLEHDPISGMENIDFVDDIWQRFFFKRKNSSSSRESIDDLRIPQIKTRIVISPKSITKLFSSIYCVLQSYEVHSTIIIQALTQFFHFLSSELFNQILTKKKYVCRSKAVQIRMNLSVVEDWVHQQHLQLPADLLISYLNPSIQLVQLLQCLSQLDSPDVFQTTVTMFDAINSLQIRRCVTNYRYEVQEPKLPEEIERLVNEKASATLRAKNRQSIVSKSKRQSILSLFDKYNDEKKTIEDTASTGNEEEYDTEGMNETKDSKFLLPFYVPTTAQLSQQTVSLFPIIPENWMNKLDKSDKTPN
ncbi:MAG: hypothetical protein EXX96DRAFT_478865 [Benjaminiella poitrasii]|nr:MAG: hypothetical protein EXX96DRAFT_478865 [Benjaminiella poitrasii]